jgi:3,4-dihydroxy 2-butanone 4-phosphate synthase/GTP cyclohydrolase II
MSLNTIEEAISDIKHGKMVIVVDDENRENEGDFIMAAENITAADVNFMATHGRGLICAPISTEIASRLELPLMNTKGGDHHGTAFTVSIDATDGITTGISATDRERTLKILADSNTKSSDFVRPGHIFPLIAKDGGVLDREGHTEAAVDLAKLAGFAPAGVICEILNTDGSCARLDDLKLVAKRFDMKLISIEDLITYKKKELILKKKKGYDNEQTYRG